MAVTVSAQFVRTCGPTSIVDNANVQVSYDMGTTAGDDAVQFTVVLKSTSGYAAIAVRPAAGAMNAGMTGFDMYGLDASTDGISDFGLSGGFAPVAADASQDGVFVSRTTQGSEVTFVFYRKLDTSDPNDVAFTVGTEVQMAWAVGTGSPLDASWMMHTATERGAFMVTLAACPAVVPFVSSCAPTTVVTAASLTVTYRAGTVSGTDAVEFTVTMTDDTQDYASLGFRTEETSDMANYDIYAFDKVMSTIYDYGLSIPTSKPANLDAVQSGTFVSSTRTAGVTTVVFYRLMDTQDVNDFVLVRDTVYTLGWAVGPGTPQDGSWGQHNVRDKVRVEVKPCDTPAPPTPAPTVAPPTPAPLIPPTPAPATEPPATIAPTAVPATSAPATPAPDTPVPNTAVPTQAPPVSTTQFDTGKGMIIEWVLSQDQLSITMTLTCPTSQWCAIGFGASMADADTVTCSLTECSDGLSTSTSMPVRDADQLITAVTSEVVGATTKFTFTRMLASADPADRAVTLGINKIIWAVGPSNTLSAMHTGDNKGAAEISTVAFTPTDAPVVPDTPVPNTAVPTQAPPVSTTGFDTGKGMTIDWVLSQDQLSITMTLTCPTSQWCAIGFGASMADADTVTCSLTECSDGLSTSTSMPTRDADQLITAVTSEVVGATTKFTFTRTLASADPADRAVTLGINKIIWAVGPSNTLSAMHAAGNRGAAEISTVAFTPTDAPLVATTPGEMAFMPDSSANKFDVKWASTDESITFTITCKQGSWCALGLGTTKMSGADTILCDESGCKDTTLPLAAGAPITDTTQNLVVGSATVADGHFTVAVTRKLNTGDAADYVIPPAPAKIEMMWATGPMTNGAPEPHTHKGSMAAMEVRGAAAAAATRFAVPFAPGKFTFMWDINEATGDISFQYVCQAGSWCSVGFGSSMQNADTMSCYTDTTATCSDGQVSSKSTPKQDAVDNIVDTASGSTESGVSTYTFVRNVNTKDVDDVVVMNAATTVIVAYGDYSSGGPAGMRDHNNGGSYGTFNVNLYDGSLSQAGDDDVEVWLKVLSFVLLFAPAIIYAVGAHAMPGTFNAPAPLGRFLAKGGKGIVALCWIGAGVCTYFAHDKDIFFWQKAMGNVAQLVLGVTLSMPSARQSWIWLFFGMSHEVVVMFHGTVGLVFMITGLIHGIPYLNDFGEEILTIWAEDRPVVAMAGFIAMVVMVALFFGSLIPLRRAAYHIFLMIHWTFVPIILIFSVLHVPATVWYLLPGMLSLIAQRFLREHILPWYTVVSKQDTESQMYTKLTLSPPKPFRCAQTMYPGMYILLRLRGDHLQSHPFSVVKVMPDTHALVVVIKNMGAGTSTDALIRNKVHEGSVLRLSDPLGAASIDLKNYEKVLLVGGGVGVTPCLGSLQYLKSQYVNFEMNESGGTPDKRIFFVWTVRDVELVALLKNEILAFKTAMPELQILVHYTGSETQHPAVVAMGDSLKTGRPDIPSLLQDITASGPRSLGVFTCGPMPLTAGVAKSVKEAQTTTIIDHHNETFEM